jgi:hypothetical protein
MPEIRPALGEREQAGMGSESSEQAVLGRSRYEGSFGDSVGDQTSSQRRHDHKGFDLTQANGSGENVYGHFRRRVGMVGIRWKLRLPTVGLCGLHAPVFYCLDVVGGDPKALQEFLFFLLGLA